MRGTRGSIVGLIGILTLGALAGCSGSADRPPPGPGIVQELAPDLVLDGPELYKPASVAVGDAGDLYVLDAGNYRLYHYSPDGELLDEIGRKGEGVGEFPFLGESSNRVLLAGAKLLVVMARARRVNVWDLDDGAAWSFRVDTFTLSAGFDGKRLHVGTTTTARDDPVVRVYSLDGELVDGYGKRWEPGWRGDLAGREYHLWRAAQIATSPSGRVYETLKMWPRVRAFDDGELVWDNWYDLAWLRGQPIYEVFHRPRSLAESLTVDDLGPESQLRAVMTVDVAATADALVVFLGGALLQIYGADGIPGPTYALLRSDEAPGPRRSGPHGYRIGVNANGRRLCVPEVHDARVLCYALPDQPALDGGGVTGFLSDE